MTVTEYPHGGYRLHVTPGPDGRATWAVTLDGNVLARGSRGEPDRARATAAAVADCLAASIPAPPDGAEAKDSPCPACGTPALHIEVRPDTVEPPVAVAVAGAQDKLLVGPWPWLVCRACGTQGKARRWPADGPEFRLSDLSVPSTGKGAS